MRMRFTLACLTAVALTGCGSEELNETGDSVADVEAPGDDQLDPVNGAWLVDELTLDGERIALDPSWPITLSVDADTISGTAACNQYTGTIDVSFEAGYGRFVVSDLSWTEMACESPVMEIEEAFLSALQAVESYEAADGLYVAEAGVGTNFHLSRPDAEAPPTTVTTTESPASPPEIEGLDRDGGVDGPVMYAARVDGMQDQMAAEIIGTLELDGDCLYTAFEGNRYPVLWPYGTTWDEDTSSVVLADGSVLALGDELSGGGGYLYPDTIGGLTSSSSVLARAEQCGEEPYFEIAVLQSS